MPRWRHSEMRAKSSRSRCIRLKPCTAGENSRPPPRVAALLGSDLQDAFSHETPATSCMLRLLLSTENTAGWRQLPAWNRYHCARNRCCQKIKAINATQSLGSLHLPRRSSVPAPVQQHAPVLESKSKALVRLCNVLPALICHCNDNVGLIWRLSHSNIHYSCKCS